VSVLTNGTHYSRKHQRRSIRLKGYDYSQVGTYFITVCTYRREPIFGNIVGGEMQLNEYAKIVLRCWNHLPEHCPNMQSSTFVIMPNHIHGIVVIKDTKSVRRYSLPEIVRVLKMSSTRRINNMRGTAGTPVWQRNYWEHIIRNQEALNRVHNYILANPERWHLDRENPNRSGEDDFDRWLTKNNSL
jgi:putative transposase